MGQISLRPELVTSGGEACGIMMDGQYVGALTLLYREQDRVWGSIQLDEEMLVVDEKEEVDMFVHQYIDDKIDALSAPECLVTVTYSEFDHVVSTDELGEIEEIVEVDSATYLDPMEEDEENTATETEYVDVLEDEQVDLVFHLIREDGETLIYDIYEQEENRGSRLGTITLDMSYKEIPALVEFVNPRDAHIREQIAYQFIDAFEEEWEFDALSMTMNYDNEVIDEYTFEMSEQLMQ